ncbi:MAG: translation initiation factor IF-2 N-terminal domain-containing protein, partial [Acidobacteria bacterium]|nr:translation initiation factor IF-2 N-terminal domain-containing protein [Acidobacteriota bacterium]
MSKIRINELARELEVKPGVILDLLPELGVSDKKTHSSSLDDDVALNIRQLLAGKGEGAGYVPHLDDDTESSEPVAVEEAVQATPPVKPAAPVADAPPVAASTAPAAPSPVPAVAPKETDTPPPALAAPPPAEERERETPAPIRPPIAPVRPPLAAGKTSVPSIPIPPRPTMAPKAIRPPLLKTGVGRGIIHALGVRLDVDLTHAVPG